MPHCSIVIRAYNEEKHIGRLLEGIHQQSIKDVEVILVNSGSTDKTAEIAKADGVKIVEIDPRDFTFGRSLNKGIEQTTAELVVIASAHIYPVYPDWLEKLLDPFSSLDIALVYGKQRGNEKSHFSEQQIFNSWYGEESKIPQNHPFCNNANAAIRKTHWRQHPYDETLPGLEDLEWAKWAISQNLKVAYAAEAEIVHVHEESWHGIQKRYLREGMAFKQIYPHEQFSYPEFLRLFIKNSINDMREAVRLKKLRSEILKILRFRWQQFHGTYLGYKRSGPLTWQLKQSFYYPQNGFIKEDKKRAVRSVEPIQYK
jgi:glycosyltransferase involved in cell wall biosynthesis